MTFVSSYEQDSRVLTKAKHELTSTTPELRTLYGRLQLFFLEEIRSGTPRNEQYLPFLLRQMQVAVFLGITNFRPRPENISSSANKR